MSSRIRGARHVHGFVEAVAGDILARGGLWMSNGSPPGNVGAGGNRGGEQHWSRRWSSSFGNIALVANATLTIIESSMEFGGL